MRITRRTALLSLGGAVGLLGLSAGGVALVDAEVLPGKSALNDALGRCAAAPPPAALRSTPATAGHRQLPVRGAPLPGRLRHLLSARIQPGRRPPRLPGPARVQLRRRGRNRYRRLPAVHRRRRPGDVTSGTRDAGKPASCGSPPRPLGRAGSRRRRFTAARHHVPGGKPRSGAAAGGRGDPTRDGGGEQRGEPGTRRTASASAGRSSRRDVKGGRLGRAGGIAEGHPRRPFDRRPGKGQFPGRRLVHMNEDIWSFSRGYTFWTWFSAAMSCDSPPSSMSKYQR